MAVCAKRDGLSRRVAASGRAGAVAAVGLRLGQPELRPSWLAIGLGSPME
jgi:hypothetical protein